MSAASERSRKGSLTNYPLTLCRQDGAHTDVLYHASVYRDQGAAVLGVLAVPRDVNRYPGLRPASLGMGTAGTTQRVRHSVPDDAGAQVDVRHPRTPTASRPDRVRVVVRCLTIAGRRGHQPAAA